MFYHNAFFPLLPEELVYILIMNKCIEQVLYSLSMQCLVFAIHELRTSVIDRTQPMHLHVQSHYRFNSLLSLFSVKTNWMRLFRWVIHWVCTGATFDDKLCISDHISYWLCLHKCSNRKIRFSRISATYSFARNVTLATFGKLNPPNVLAFRLCFSDMIWYDMIWYDMIWYDMIWYDMIWYDMIWYDMIWYDMIWYDMIWYDMIWYDMIWYCMIWYDMIWYDMYHFITFESITQQ